jgi:hypothetical protein
MSDDLPTPRSTLRSGLRVLVRCTACRHRDYADLQRLIDDGRGDVPLIRLRYRCSNCPSGERVSDDGAPALLGELRITAHAG